MSPICPPHRGVSSDGAKGLRAAAFASLRVWDHVTATAGMHAVRNVRALKSQSAPPRLPAQARAGAHEPPSPPGHGCPLPLCRRLWPGLAGALCQGWVGVLPHRWGNLAQRQG